MKSRLLVVSLALLTMACSTVPAGGERKTASWREGGRCAANYQWAREWTDSCAKLTSEPVCGSISQYCHWDQARGQ